MKTFKLTIATTLIITLTSCGVKKSLTRLETNTSTLEKTNSHEKQLELHTYSNYIKLSDSTEHLYKITIYPTDSLFQFSIQEGFKGKATKVEITGLTKHRSYATDSTLENSINSKEKQIKSIKKTSNKATSVAKAVNRTKNYWVLVICLAVGVMVLIIWKFTTYTLPQL